MSRQAKGEPGEKLASGTVPRPRADTDLIVQEGGRKALHLLALVIPVGLMLASRPLMLALLVPAAALAVFADWWRVRSPGFGRFIDRVFGRLMRPSERLPAGSPARLNGATWVLVASAATILLFRPPVAAAALAMFMVGDAAAALIGGRYGRRRIGRSKKTYEGTLAFVVAAAPVAWLLPAANVWIGLAGALAAAAGEALPGPLNDNLRSPLLAGLVMTALLIILPPAH